MRLALLHGFTQAGRSWDPIRTEFEARGRAVVAPDLPGHGTAFEIRADVAAAAALVADQLGDQATAGPTIWVGYSMGGRVALHAAVDRPAAVAGLVLVSTTAGIDDDAERADRRADDERLASEIEVGGVGPFIERWLSGPLWSTLPRERAGVDVRRANTASGLASSLRLAGTGSQRPLWSRLGTISAPTLVVTGTADAKFTVIGDRIAAAIPGAGRVHLAGGGHAVPWEQPEAFVDAVDAWIDEIGHRMRPTASSSPNTS